MLSDMPLAVRQVCKPPLAASFWSLSYLQPAFWQSSVRSNHSALPSVRKRWPRLPSTRSVRAYHHSAMPMPASFCRYRHCSYHSGPTQSGHNNRPELVRSITAFPDDFSTCLGLGRLQEEDYESLINSQVTKPLKTELEYHLDKAARLWNVALIVENGGLL